jgi:hypothetical protein
MVVRSIGLSQRKAMIRDPKSLVRACKVTEKSTDEGQWNMKKPVCDRRKFTEA